MNKKKILILLIIIIALLSVGCTGDKAPIRLATYTYASNDRIENLKLLSKELEDRLQRKVMVTSYPDVKSFILGIKSNEVDIAFINTLGYLILSSDNEHMLPVANLHIEEEPVDNYKTVLLTNNDSVAQYSDIVEKAQKMVMMFVTEGSTSGNLVPRLFLNSIGVTSPESQFKEVRYGGNHTLTFEKLVEGEIDLCAIGSNEYFKQIQEDSTLVNRIRSLWVSEEIPLGPVLVNKELSFEERDIVINALLALHIENVDAFKMIKSGWSEAGQADRFHRVTDSYYDNFRIIDKTSTDFSDILKLLKQ